MIGDVEDFVGRLWGVLPVRWFGDSAPVGSAVLAGFGTAWSRIYDLIAFVRDQSRLLTASGSFIDMIGADFFGAGLPRRGSEADTAYTQRLSNELLRARTTRAALHTALLQLTGREPHIFEPARPADTGGYAVGGVGYGVGGALGSLQLSYQCLVGVQRPLGAGIAQLAGYHTGGVPAYGSLALVIAPVSDTEIYACVAAVMPAGYSAWVQIQA